MTRADPQIVVILGAAVWAGGSPSGAMLRRVSRALELRERVPGVAFMPTGGVGRHPPAEAKVMRDLLVEAGVPIARIQLEDTAKSTLASAVACAALLGERSSSSSFSTAVWVCSDDYHMLRSRVLFWMLGVRTRAWIARPSRGESGAARLRCWVRDAVALAVDVPLLGFWLVIGRTHRS